MLVQVKKLVKLILGHMSPFSFFSVSRSRLPWMANIQLNYSVLNSYLAVPTLYYGTAKQPRTRKVVCAILHMLGENSPFVVFSCILNTTFKVQIYEKIFVSFNCSLFVCRLFGVHIFILYIHPSQSADNQGNTKTSAIFGERW